MFLPHLNVVDSLEEHAYDEQELREEIRKFSLLFNEKKTIDKALIFRVVNFPGLFELAPFTFQTDRWSLDYYDIEMAKTQCCLYKGDHRDCIIYSPEYLSVFLQGYKA